MRRTCNMPCGCFWPGSRSGVGARIGIIGCGLLFAWVGLALLLDVGWGAGLLGIGGVVLFTQAVRRGNGLPLEGLWIFVGFAFVLAGTWELAAIDVALGPILLLAFGLVVVLSVVRPKANRDNSRTRRSRREDGDADSSR